MKDPNVIIDIVCDYFELERRELFKKSRKHEIVYPRQILHYLLKHNTKRTYSQIGKIGADWGQVFDHATTIYSVRKVTDYIDSNDIRTVNDLADLNHSVRGLPKFEGKKYSSLSLELAKTQRQLQEEKKKDIPKELQRLFNLYSKLNDDRKEKALIQIETSLKIQNMQHQKLRTA